MMIRSVHLEFGLGHIEHCIGRRTGLGLIEFFSSVRELGNYESSLYVMMVQRADKKRKKQKNKVKLNS
jgi:hypothetical protein